VGVVRSPWFSDGPQSHGTLLPTPALLRTYGPNPLIDSFNPVAALALALVTPLALVVANLLAAWPGLRAARLRIGDALRAE
jgi:hypothetical protein